jgi:acid phosphatase
MSLSPGSAAPNADDQGREEITIAAKSIRNMPGATVPLDVESYPVAPAELQLEQVHVYVRHGTSPELRPCMSTLCLAHILYSFVA